MNGHIFISYRREDSAHVAGRLFDRLSQRFGKDRVFMDIDTIELGADFVASIEKAVSECDVLIALIGKNWLDITDESGRRRLDNPNDFVRAEISAALKRDIPVIPVLVDGAAMPRAGILPGELSALAYRNGMPLDYMRFDADVDRLIRSLEEAIKKAGKTTKAGKRTSKKVRIPVWGWILGGILLVALLLVWLSNLQSVQSLFQGGGDVVYDDFENPAYDGDYDHSKWSYFSTSTAGKAVQRDGVLKMTKDEYSVPVFMYAREYEDILFDTPTFFEAKMELDPGVQENGVAAYGLSFNLPAEESLYAYCTIDYGGPTAYCGEQASWLDYADIYTTKPKPTDAGRWHSFRIEIDFDTLEIVFFIDDELYGSDRPNDVEGIRDANQSMFLIIYSEEVPLTGYFDDVRVGPVR